MEAHTAYLMSTRTPVVCPHLLAKLADVLRRIGHTQGALLVLTNPGISEKVRLQGQWRISFSTVDLGQAHSSAMIVAEQTQDRTPIQLGFRVIERVLT